eukprot:CAMPEP_0201585388 /NCGR_PEP_ID=MMETSP0190_2-20130828/121374_1 /ASSEMBLY_ACC=CAM_ASM_000263 /TAXON_ID=37353 /ORGANISM="Rosalina sp." /LENGTH=56 /DNA_ID=CAMNT_0048031245 /DNA_START=236 /DNA_END=406 /DNA_ORIENTATION=-
MTTTISSDKGQSVAIQMTPTTSKTGTKSMTDDSLTEKTKEIDTIPEETKDSMSEIP